EVAHDFNNLLMVMLTGAEATLQTLPDGPARPFLGSVLQAGQRAADLIRRLSAVGRARPAGPAALDLAAAVADLDPLLPRVVGRSGDVGLGRAEGLGHVWVAPSQIDQVLLNLVANARDAMPAGGQLTIRTSPEGGRAVLAVSDTGHGMDGETKARIFEPFFTT